MISPPATGNKDMFAGTFFFDPADGIYADHFPGNPVVPGSLIVHAFLEAAASLGLDFPGREIENFGFREFLTPGEYPFTMEIRGDRIICRLYDGSKTMVTGAIRK
jgi:3-hydroxyacyl-[acyl-carrier-protein] dehydratase